MSVYIRKKKTKVNEDNAQQITSTQQQTSPQKVADANKIEQINNQILQINAQIQDAEQQFNDRVEQLKNQKLQLQKQLVDAGGSLKTDESFRPKYKDFSRNLYESLQMNKAEILAALIKNTFDRLENISFSLSESGCLRLARKMINFLNMQNWNDGRNHWDEVEDCVREFLSRGTVSFARREIDDFTKALAEDMKKDNTFAWIFGNERYS